MWFKVNTEVLDVKAFRKSSQKGDEFFYMCTCSGFIEINVDLSATLKQI